MEEEFILKHYGNFSLFEMAHMNAMERSWHIERLKEELKKSQSSQQLPKVPRK